ncbi:intermembrane transport protein PqiB [Neopusillimonas maritima]|jgi:paraquat-inducible protein B|uniref:Paraquat-inducible protein B n=1 Tax=Neopusillimonas maritima TaxID=2026239 RepID=A0ABX9MXT3_9BURK|nr:MlaD family protein [Neopusillimonas maritima]MAL01839.1 paraquat-inducible protein B [Alcaligenaceae bacterium]RII83757.1 paraquat-inducible protein B [Neopusillimonas maritima]
MADEPVRQTEQKSPSTLKAHKPSVKERRAWRISWIWLVPFVAALVGGSLLVRNWLNTGPTLSITFESAEGLEIDQTKVRYKDVVIGVVTDIDVGADRSNVIVKAQIDHESADYIARDGTRFWVVKPRLEMSGVSGLGTLLSGPYIAVDIESDNNQNQAEKYTFTGLEKPPAVTHDRSGTRYVLHAADLGSLEIGSQVYYRQIPVGRVIDYELNKDGSSVDIQIFVDEPNDRYVTSDSRFWNASGIRVSLGASGVEVQTGTLSSIVAGGIAFANVNPANEIPAKPETVFDLFNSELEAKAEPDGPPFRVDMIFNNSVRGLEIGAPVDFRGMELGKVYDIDLEFDTEKRRFYILVKTNIYPRRFGTAYDRVKSLDPENKYPGRQLLGPMVHHGLRAQLKTSNLLTGQQYVSLDIIRDAEPVDFDPMRTPLVIPTIAGSFDRLQEQIMKIVSKIEAVPFEGIGNDLQKSLQSLNRTLNTLNTEVAPQTTEALAAAKDALERIDAMLSDDSSMNENLQGTLRELNGAARSLRNLGDYLQSHPNALITGTPPDRYPE